MEKQILSEEFRRMQKLAGIITESYYINEIEFTKGKVYNSLTTGKKHRSFFFSYTIK